MEPKLMIVDPRGRCSLAKVRSYPHARYLVEELENGTLILTPAELVPIKDLPHDDA
jgi:hypothetical protein